jgi:hypothetical protein
MTDIRESQRMGLMLGAASKRTHRRVEWPARIVAILALCVALPLMAVGIGAFLAWAMR